MATVYKAACELISRNDFSDADASPRKDFCCLCFNAIGTEEEAKCVDDEVVLDSIYGESTEELSNVVLNVLGDDYSENMAVFKSICDPCSKSAINSFKFKQKCKESIDQFNNALENLTDCFDSVADDLYSYRTMFVSINTTDWAMDQFYDNKAQTKDTALARFTYLVHGRRLTSNKKKENGKMEISEGKYKRRRERDFSTIFIKTQELMENPQSKEFKCKICGKVYPTSGSLRLHFFSKHFKKEFQCSNCPKSFGTAGLLQTHINDSHCTVTCQVCGKTLMNRASTIKRHQQTHTTKLRKTCHRCGRSYRKTTDFNRHLEQDTCEMPSRVAGNFICDHCGKHCHFKSQLTLHIRHEHGDAKGHVCPWCKRKCYNASALKVHILKHTGEKNYVCTTCGGKFVTRQSLVNHTRLHTGERPYPCLHCDQSFLSASRRKEHIERHHTDATFECDLCDAKYSARRSLLKHKKRHLTEELEVTQEKHGSF